MQRCAMQAGESGASFRELLASEPRVREKFAPGELDACFDPAYYMRRVDLIYRRLGLK